MRCKNMKPFILITLVLGLVSCELPVNKRPLIFSNNNWPPKSAKQLGPAPPGKQRTLVVQIRSDQPVPLVLKGRPGSHSHAHQHLAPHSHSSLSHGHGHAHLQHAHHAHLHSHPHSHAHAHLLQGGLPHNLRGSRPLKLSAPVYLKHAGSIRKPLKIKLSNSKLPAKPTFGYEKPFKYEKPSAVAFSELQNLPLDTHNNFNNEHFAPIYTVPAPNLALHDNQLDEGIDSAYLPPQHTTRPATQSTQRPQSTYYSVHEDETNDLTIRDPISGSQKFFAPDPDPSLPTSKVKVATESFNTPSNKKPLPADVQSNHLPAQPLVQIVGAQSAAQTVPVPIYPIQFAQQQTTQPFIAAAAHIPIYNPTYLVTQSNQLYSQHKQQLFKPSTEHVIETGYVNADLTQEVASNGQILQAAKDPHHQIHPVLDTAPQYAALIAAPALGEPTEPVFETASFHLPNVAAVASSSPEGGFVVSNYYGNAHDSSQLLQAYAEEEAQRQQLETEHAAFELQKQHQLQQQQNLQEQLQQQNLQEQLQQQQQQIHLEALHAQAQQQYQQEQQQQQQYQQELQQHQQQQQQQQQQYQQELHLEELKAQAHEQHLQQQQQQQQIQLQQLQQQHQQLQQQQPQQHSADPAAAAFEEHQRLVQQQLGSNTPLRIFVPDEETADTQRLQKRSDNLKKGTFEDVPALDDSNATKDLFPVSTSVEVTGGPADVSSI